MSALRLCWFCANLSISKHSAPAFTCFHLPKTFGQVRTVEIDNEPWFVGKDVAEALGYSNPQKAVRDHVDEEDRTVNESFTVHGTPITLINESGLYSLILTCSPGISGLVIVMGASRLHLLFLGIFSVLVFLHVVFHRPI